MALYSFTRQMGMIRKEFIQMRRDKPTLAMMIFLPLVQLILFGYAINSNPKHLPTALVVADDQFLSYEFVQAMENTDYFRFVNANATEAEAEDLITRGFVSFVVNIPYNFTRDVIRGDRPAILIEADASDPSATGNATSALQVLSSSVFNYYLQGSLNHLIPEDDPFDLIIHNRYNPLAITSYNIVPGLLGVVLTMTLVVVASQALTRERERGTYESLLATPMHPIEIMIGKIVPFIIMGYFQVCLILFMAYYLFGVPIEGSLVLLFILVLPFIAANLSVGITFSTVAKNQLQAVQMATFFFLPSILLSGFMFPFAGMPQWAQAIGNILPLTHFLQIVRGIMLKGNTFMDIWHTLWPILLFMIVVMAIGLKRFRQTLD